MVRISGVGAAGSVKKSTATSSKGKTVSKGTSKRDRVKISDASTLREMAKSMMADMPEVRLERIESIRDALEQGTFQCDSQKVAAQIVRNALAERVW